MLPVAPARRKPLALAVGGLLLLGLLLFGLLRGHTNRVQRIRLRVEALEGLQAGERAGLEQLLIHQLEVLGGVPVLNWPDAAQPAAVASDQVLQLQVGARRRGPGLGFELAWSRGAQGTRRVQVIPSSAPEEALKRLFQALPLRLESPGAGRAWPREAAPFWDLVASMGLVDVRSEGQRSLALAQAVVARAPDCAEAQINLGAHLYSHLQWNPDRDAGVLNLAVSSFEAGLASQPGHPWGTRDLAVLLTDTGRGREALDLLSNSIVLRPRVPRLYEALAYTARTSGLLEISLRAIRTQHQLALDQTRQVGETTLLYAGDWTGFLTTCEPGGAPSDAKAWFYRGYVALARGDREGALKTFRAARSNPEGWYGFEDLAGALALHLEGRGEEARKAMIALDRARVGLRIPDGEFTFKQAEVNAVLGNLGEAMDLANRAFAQGFCCVGWYEGSPFLGPIRTHPKWTGLLQRAHDRQALMDVRYSPSRFGL